MFQVDEYGTEAAAATRIVVVVLSMPSKVTVDRPFMYAIIHTQANDGALVRRQSQQDR